MKTITFLIILVVFALYVIPDRNTYEVGVLSYQQDIKPIFTKHCSECHPGALSYDVAYQQRQKILVKLSQQRTMPPKHRERPTQQELETVANWIKQGANP